MFYDYLIVGAGFSGTVLAERLASRANKKVCIIDKRNHIGGNSYDCFDETGILIHKYGPHWFHTNSDDVYNYLSKFTQWIEHKHIIKSNLNGKLFPFPINIDTINSFFNVELKTGNDAKDFIGKKKIEIRNPKNAEEMVLSLLGKELYKAFYENYTIKQWNIHPKDLSASITARIPVRYDNRDSYFNDKYQLMPKNGYTAIFEKMLDHKNISLFLDTDFNDLSNDVKYDKLIYTGPIDEFFGNCFGELPYRSLRFEHQAIKKEFYQECQQINYPNENNFTRIVEWKHATGQKSDITSIMREYPVKYESGMEKFYPIPFAEGNEILLKYKDKSKDHKNAIFCGRLAEYKYYNMDQVVAQSLKIFNRLVY